MPRETMKTGPVDAYYAITALSRVRGGRDVDVGFEDPAKWRVVDMLRLNQSTLLKRTGILAGPSSSFPGAWHGASAPSLRASATGIKISKGFS